MALSIFGLERSSSNLEEFQDRRGYGIKYRIPMSGANAGRTICTTPGVALYSTFSTWTDLPVGSLVQASDKNYVTYVFASDLQWIPVGNQFTGNRNLGSSRALNAEDNGCLLFNQIGTPRSLQVDLTLPLSFTLTVLQASTGTITFTAGSGVTITAASLATGGPGKILRLARIDSANFLAY